MYEDIIAFDIIYVYYLRISAVSKYERNKLGCCKLSKIDGDNELRHVLSLYKSPTMDHVMYEGTTGEPKT